MEEDIEKGDSSVKNKTEMTVKTGENEIESLKNLIVNGSFPDDLKTEIENIYSYKRMLLSI